MCVCAGATGAAVVPVVHKARASLFHRAAVHSSAVPRASTPLPITCAPTIASAVPPIAAPASSEAVEMALLAAPGGGGLTGAGGGFIAPAPGIGGGGGIPGAGPYLPPVVPPVGAGAVPEPATWTMLVSGFGMVGAGVRWQRRQDA